MAKKQITQLVADSSPLALGIEVARNNAAEAASRSYGAEREYAKALNAHFGGLSVAWYTVEHNAKGAEADLVHKEKQAYFEALHAKHPTGKYPNTSVPWARVRKYAEEETRAEQRRVIAEQGLEMPEELQEAAGSTGARHTRSLTLRMTEDLTALFKAGRKAEKEGTISTKEAAALVSIGSALTALGLDLASLA